jgi:hypothetical protein
MCIQPTHFEVITRDLAEKFTSHLTVSLILGAHRRFSVCVLGILEICKAGIIQQ